MDFVHIAQPTAFHFKVFSRKAISSYRWEQIIIFVTKCSSDKINGQLNWDNHIKMKNAKLAKSNEIIFKAGRYVDETSLKILYFVHFMPHLSYCVGV